MRFGDYYKREGLPHSNTLKTQAQPTEEAIKTLNDGAGGCCILGAGSFINLNDWLLTLTWELKLGIKMKARSYKMNDQLKLF